MSFFSRTRKNLQKLAGSKLGSVLTGRAIIERKIQKSELKSARIIDFFGSPATAGTKQQTTARAAAVVYGVAAGGAALGAGNVGASSGAAAGGAAGGAASATAVTTSATGWGATLASTAKYTGLALALSRQFGIGPGAPNMGPETIPSENYLPNGLQGAIYPGYEEGGFGFGGPGLFPAGNDSSSTGFFDSIGGPSTAYIVAGLILLAGLFFAFRR